MGESNVLWSQGKTLLFKNVVDHRDLPSLLSIIFDTIKVVIPKGASAFFPLRENKMARFIHRPAVKSSLGKSIL